MSDLKQDLLDALEHAEVGVMQMSAEGPETVTEPVPVEREWAKPPDTELGAGSGKDYLDQDLRSVLRWFVKTANQCGDCRFPKGQRLQYVLDRLDRARIEETRPTPLTDSDLRALLQRELGVTVLESDVYPSEKARVSWNEQYVYANYSALRQPNGIKRTADALRWLAGQGVA